MHSRKLLRVVVSLVCLVGATLACGPSGPPECTKDLDCQSLGQICLENKCVVNDDPLCPNFCSRTDDCQKCTRGRDHCVKNRCVKPPTSELYAQCSTTIGLCQDGASCAKLSDSVAHGYCLQACDVAKGKCEGGGDCVPSGSGQGLCLPKGTGAEGNSCKLDPEAKTFDASKICVDGLHCIGEVCKKPVVVKTYEACGAGKVCSSNDIQCLQLVSTSTSGFCVPKCDTKNKECDGGKGSCIEVNGLGYCLPKGAADEGAACGLDTNQKLEASRICKGSLKCVESKCQAAKVVGHFDKCDSTLLLCPPTTAKCLELSQGSTFGYCLPLCTTPNQTDCANGTGACQVLPDNTRVCMLKGTAQLDAPCGPKATDEKLAASFLCKEGLSCLFFSQNATGGLCLPLVQECAQGACPSGRVCLPLARGGACAKDCANGGTCPTHAKCERVLVQGGNSPEACVPK